VIKLAVLGFKKNVSSSLVSMTLVG